MDTTKLNIKNKTVPGTKFKSTAIMVPGAQQTRAKKLSEAATKTLRSQQSKSNLTQAMVCDSQESMPNGQRLPSSQVSDDFPDSQVSVQESSSEMSVHSGMPDWVLNFTKELREVRACQEEQASRLTAVERLTAENLQLKASLQAAQDKIALLESRLAQDHHHNPASELNVVCCIFRLDHHIVHEDVDFDMVTEASFPALVSHKLSSSDSKWATVTKSNVPAPKKTMAQIVSSSAKNPPAKKGTSLKKKVAIGRPFLEQSSGPQGFKYVYIPRARKMTRIEVRTRLRQIGVDTSRVLDIIFPAAGTIGVLLHIQYVKSFTAIMVSIGGKTLDSFDVLDPKHLGDPKYLSYTEDGRATKAMELHANRCLSALTFLRRTKHHQVQPVGRSFVSLGWITDRELLDVLSLPSDSSSSGLKTVSRPGNVFVLEQGDTAMDGGDSDVDVVGDFDSIDMDQDAKSVVSDASL
ncbi:hypothetical protein MFLAVUS_010618 [Mucor flavus]|uniref:Uncharacterized protein n=1 Tax=Mucor flavus TaxID=439312 RepID=A0ABP9ZD85_9FUNG